MLDLIGRTGQVTRKEIHEGTRHSCYKCPVAIVMYVMIPEAEEIRVNVGNTKVYTDDDLLPTATLIHSGELNDWIRKFDNKKKISPIDIGIARQFIDNALVLEIVS